LVVIYNCFLEGVGYCSNRPLVHLHFQCRVEPKTATLHNNNRARVTCAGPRVRDVGQNGTS
jgi:hypothetical protein